MSLAIPATYSEYIFDQTSRHADPAMICDGHIMPLRRGDEHSTDFRYCLRGEDIFFLMEAIHLRNAFSNGGSVSPGIEYNEIRADRLAAMQAVVRAIKTQWQESALTVSAHDFGRAAPRWSDVHAWLLQQVQGIGVPACDSDTYQDIAHRPVLNFFRDVKKMNYSVDVGGGNGWITLNSDTDHTNHLSEYNAATGWEYSDVPDGTLWWNSHGVEYSYPYTGAISHELIRQPVSNTLRFVLNPLGAGAAWPWYQVVDVLPLVLVQVENHWSWSNETADDYGSATKWVLVPVATAYTSVTAGAPVAGLVSADSLITSAFRAAGLVRACDSIPFGTTPPADASWSKESRAVVTGVFCLVHMKYCNLENVVIT